METIELHRRLDLFEVIEELPSMKTFSPHILYNLSAHIDSKELLQRARNIPANQLIGKRRARLNMYNVGSQLGGDCGTTGNFLKMSAITHNNAERTVFPWHPRGARKVIVYYYGSVVYSDLGE